MVYVTNCMASGAMSERDEGYPALEIDRDKTQTTAHRRVI